MEEKIKYIINEKSRVTHAVAGEFRTDRGPMYRTVCHIDAFANRGYHPILAPDAFADCANCRQILSRDKSKSVQDKEWYMVEDCYANEVMAKSDDLDELLNILREHHSDETIYEEISNGGWKVYKSRLVRINPEVETEVLIISLREEI